MSQIIEGRRKSFTAGAAIAKNLRVKLSAGVLAVAGIADQDIGTLEEASFASGDVRSVNLNSLQGTRLMVANGAITAGARVFAAASGKISATAAGPGKGIALEAAAADGDTIEVLPDPSGMRVIYGQATTVAASDTIVTGLATVVAVVAGFDDSPGDDPNYVSASIGDQAGTPAAGSFLLKTWKNTGGTDPTPLAATTFSKKINYIAIGT